MTQPKRMAVPVIPAAASSPRMARLAARLLELRSFNEYVFVRPNYNSPLATRLRPEAAQALAFNFLIQVWGYGETHGYRESKNVLVVPDCQPVMADRETGLEGFGDVLLELGEVVVREKDLVFPQYGAGIAVSSAAERSKRFRMKKKLAKERAALPPPPPGAPPPPPPTAEAKQTGVHKQAVEMWVAAWERRWGEKYAFNGAKDGVTIKWLLTAVSHDLDKLKGIVERYLDDPDPFYVTSHHPLSNLRSQFSRWQFETKGGWHGGRAATGGVGRAGRAEADPAKYAHLDSGVPPAAVVGGPGGDGPAGGEPVAPQDAPADPEQPTLFG